MSLDKYKIKINHEITIKIGGKELTEALKYFDVTHVMDINAFVEGEKRYPYLGSIFLCGAGSCDFEDDKYGDVYIYNGALSSISNNDMDAYSPLYYQQHFGEPLFTMDQCKNDQ